MKSTEETVKPTEVRGKIGSMSKQTITEFLEARIAEDKERASSGWARLGDSRWETTNEGQDFLTPSAVLAECAAKRAIIFSYRSCMEADAHTNITTEFGVKLTVGGMVKGLELSVKHLAAVYADHEDYQQEWKL